MIGYLQRHWYGKQTLGWSFWVNLVAIRCGVFLIQNSLAPADGADYGHHRGAVVVFIVVFHIALLMWALVGVVRAADNHFAENGNMALVWGAQLGGVLFFVLTALYVLGAVQMTLPESEDNGDALTQMAEEHASQYTLTFSDNGEVLFIQGIIELGITRIVTSALLQYPDVRTVVLESQGGNIYEARGLAQLFSKQRLATHVRATCASACSIAFVGGVSRSADNGAAFGFHQYRVDAEYAIIATDVGKEQARDQQRFLDAGVSRAFVEEVFSQPSSAMWWPELTMLQDVRFLHEIQGLQLSSEQ